MIVQSKTKLNNELLITNYIDELSSAIERMRAKSSDIRLAADILSNASQVTAIGVGKSSYVAQKFVSSLRSLSVPADFIHAAEALHGDLGRVGEDTVAVVFSKSGTSSEILSTLPVLLGRSVPIVTITNRPDSTLAQNSTHVIPLGIHREGDEKNVLPLISTDVSLVVANLIVALIAQQKGFDESAFALNHPGGQLGFAVGTNIMELQSWKKCRPFVTVDTSIMDATVVMSEHRAGIACVVNNHGQLLGILSDGDLRHALSTGVSLQTATVRDWMNTTPRTVRDNASVTDTLNYLESGDRRVFAAPVISSCYRCIGVVTIHDLVN